MTKNYLDLYDPANAGNLTEQDVADMQNLTSDEINALAKKFKNRPSGNNYLILFNKQLAADKQLFPESTWQNLASLRDNNARPNFVAFSFKQIFNRKQGKAPGGLPTAKVQDIKKEDLKVADGVKNVEEAAVVDTTKMNKKDLVAAYAKKFGKAPGKSMTIDFLREALSA